MDDKEKDAILLKILEEITEIKKTMVTKSEFEEFAEKIEARLEALEERMTALEERVTALEERVAALEERVTELEKRVAELEKDMKEFRSELNEVKLNMVKMEFTLTDKIDALFDAREINLDKFEQHDKEFAVINRMIERHDRQISRIEQTG